MKFASGFRRALVECEVYRNGQLINTIEGLIHDSKDLNMISFDPDVDVQINDDIFCPLKNKHYIITNTDIALFNGEPHRLDAYFENNFSTKTATTVFNTYNPNNSVIGNQQNVTLNINDCFNNLQDQITKQNEDKEELQELLNILKTELSNNTFNKSKLSKFNQLISKHISWLMPMISQIITAWLQR